MEQDWANLDNAPFLTRTEKYVRKSIAEGTVFRLSPTDLLKKPAIKRPRPVPASDLKVDSSFNHRGEEGCHFKKFTVDGDGKKWLKDFQEKLFKYYIKNVQGKQLVTYVGMCVGQIASNVSMLLGPLNDDEIERRCTITSESELRFAIADPIIKMICCCWGYQLKREENSIYTLKSDQTVVVAVLIEAKMTTHSKFEHALGQVRFQSFCFRHSIRVSLVKLHSSPLQLLGYYIKFSTDNKNPPLCAVISERGVQIVLFPYVYVGQNSVIPAVDALVLPELPLLDVDFPNRYLLCLLLLLCGDQHNSYGGINIANISLTGATKKSALRNHIYSVKEMIAVELEEAQERGREAQERERLLKEKLEEREREAQEAQERERD
jgi:hypothetical protein